MKRLLPLLLLDEHDCGRGDGDEPPVGCPIANARVALNARIACSSVTWAASLLENASCLANCASCIACLLCCSCCIAAFLMRSASDRARCTLVPAVEPRKMCDSGYHDANALLRAAHLARRAPHLACRATQSQQCSSFPPAGPPASSAIARPSLRSHAQRTQLQRLQSRPAPIACYSSSSAELTSDGLYDSLFRKHQYEGIKAYRRTYDSCVSAHFGAATGQTSLAIYAHTPAGFRALRAY